MGNEQSDANERIARNVMNCIPGVNIAYNGVRAAVYAGKRNQEEAARSGYDMLGSTIMTVPVAAGPVGAAVGGIAGGSILALGDEAQKRSRR